VIDLLILGVHFQDGQDAMEVDDVDREEVGEKSVQKK